MEVVVVKEVDAVRLVAEEVTTVIIELVLDMEEGAAIPPVGGEIEYVTVVPTTVIIIMIMMTMLIVAGLSFCVVPLSLFSRGDRSA